MNCTALSRELSTGRAARRAQERVPSTSADSPVVLSGQVVSGPSFEEEGQSSASQQRADCQFLGSAVRRRSSQTPPSSSTGVQTALVDYCCPTFPLGFDHDLVKALLGSEGWVTLDTGILGYRQALRRGHVTICFDGQENMGVHVEATGKGCRELEADGVIESWSKFFRMLLDLGCTFSRNDVALDEHEGLLDVERCREYARAGQVVSRYDKAMLYEEVTLKDGEQVGGGVRFGSGKGETLIRIYDKAKEQHLPGVWNRCELQTRGKRATELARILAEDDGLQRVAAVIRGLLDFKEQGAHSQRERWASASWWDAFLGTVEKLRLTVQKVVRTVNEALDWIEHTIAPMLAAVVDALGAGFPVVPNLLQVGRERRRPKHERMIRDYRQGLAAAVP